MSDFTRIVKNEEATGALAATLALCCHSGDCILLNGDLGAGKTAFARGFIRAISDDPVEIVSPTFNLVQTYPVRSGMVWHFDLYRLKSSTEIAEIGLEEALQNCITLIEWPEIAKELLPGNALNIKINAGSKPDERIIVFSGNPGVWQERLNSIKDIGL